MVDDSCLSPSNFHDMVKAGGAVVGTRVHSIDVILGFNKDQDPLLNPGGNAIAHKVGGDCLGDPGKQDQRAHPYGHLPTLRDSSEQPVFHGESFMDKSESESVLLPSMFTHTRILSWCRKLPQYGQNGIDKTDKKKK